MMRYIGTSRAFEIASRVAVLGVLCPDSRSEIKLESNSAEAASCFCDKPLAALAVLNAFAKSIVTLDTSLLAFC